MSTKKSILILPRLAAAAAFGTITRKIWITTSSKHKAQSPFGIFAWTLCLASLLLSACAKNTVKVASDVEEIPQVESFAEISLRDSFPEPFALRESYVNYRYALEAISNSEWLLASHYLDVSLRNLIEERKDSTNLSKDDASLEKLLLSKIIRASDEVYPSLSDLGESAETWNPYEFSLEGLETGEEKIIDSVSLDVIESFLDTLDLSQFSLPLELNDRVMQEIYYFTERVPTFIKQSLNRKTAYDSLIYGILREYEMPEDLIYLSLVESGFKVKAYSRAKASGLWQFIPATGERFGLRSDFWVDMRRNPELATRAAAAYLTYLHREFDDWLLAMAAYNCGEGRVRRLIREMRADSTRDSTQKITYWDLALPKETMHYVPRILAAMVIGHFPSHYGIDVQKMDLDKYDTVTIRDCLPIAEIAKALSISEDSVHALNMELIRWSTPPDVETYTLRIPPNTREKFLKAYEKMDKNKMPRWNYHKVKKGEYLGTIAKKYGVKISDIQSANQMKSSRLRVGQQLLIPLPAAASKRQVKKSKVKATRKYVVEEGDSPASVARRYGISVSDLCLWNSISKTDKLPVGKELYVSKPVENDPSEIESEKTANLRPEATIKKEPARLPNGKYLVRSGDTYQTIALAFDVPLILLIEQNDGGKKRLRVGDELKIPEKKREESREIKKTPPKKGAQVEGKKKAPAQSKAPESKSAEYIVQKGDNLFSIAQKFGTSVSKLQEWNKLGNSEKIYAGQKLIVKEKKSGSVSQAPNKKTHLVKKGEALWDISKKYQVPIDSLIRWNNLSGTRVRQGQKIYLEK